MKIKNSTAVFASCLFLMMGCGNDSSNNSGSQDLLFTEVSAEEAQDVASDLDLGQSLKNRLAKVNFHVLKSAASRLKTGESQATNIQLSVNLFENEVVKVLISEIEKVSAENIIFNGQIAGDLDSGVTLVMNDGVLVANVRKSDATESYEIRYVSNGIHSINLKRDNFEDDCLEVDSGEAQDAATEVGMDEATAGSVIDILGAYTPYARTKAGGTSAIIALLQLGVTDTNTSLMNSGLATRVRLVGTYALERNETGNWSNDLSYLKSKTDSRWNGVHSKRTSVGADQVSVVAVYPYQRGTNGIGYIRSSYSSAFTIVRNTAFGAYTFAHELGHNIGLNHSDGYVNYSGRFRTIMAYGSYPRIRRYSNPYRTYNGYRTGTTYDNSVKIISARAYILAGLSVKKVF
jgi:peptidyl-Asp metalloendopeptidase